MGFSKKRCEPTGLLASRISPQARMSSSWIVLASMLMNVSKNVPIVKHIFIFREHYSPKGPPGSSGPPGT